MECDAPGGGIARQAGQGASQAGLGQADKRFAVSGADGETFEDRLAFHKTEQGGQRRQQFEKRVGARRRRLLALLSQFIHPRAEPIERGDIRSGGKGRVGDPLDRPADRHLAEEEFDLLQLEIDRVRPAAIRRTGELRGHREGAEADPIAGGCVLQASAGKRGQGFAEPVGSFFEGEARFCVLEAEAGFRPVCQGQRRLCREHDVELGGGWHSGRRHAADLDAIEDELRGFCLVQRQPRIGDRRDGGIALSPHLETVRALPAEDAMRRRAQFVEKALDIGFELIVGCRREARPQNRQTERQTCGGRP